MKASSNLTVSNTVCLMTIGYSTKLVVPVEKVSYVLALLRDCQIVSSEWTGDENILVKTNDRITVEMGSFMVSDRDEFNALCESVRAEKAAADLPAVLDEASSRG